MAGFQGVSGQMKSRCPDGCGYHRSGRLSTGPQDTCADGLDNAASSSIACRQCNVAAPLAPFVNHPLEPARLLAVADCTSEACNSLRTFQVPKIASNSQRHLDLVASANGESSTRSSAVDLVAPSEDRRVYKPNVG